MKITLINGSPKAQDSASQCILDDLKPLLSNQEIAEIHFKKPLIEEKDKEVLINSDVLIFAFPLYVDSVPSHVLSCLREMEDLLKSRHIYVYGIVNNGFYEGTQNAPALEVLKHWTHRTGLIWGQGVGVGSGGMLTATKNTPLGKGPKRSLGKAFHSSANNILENRSDDNLYVNANFPRFLYKFMAEVGWNRQGKKNGLEVKDLYKKLTIEEI